MRWAVVSLFVTATVAVACGARTGLDVPTPSGPGGNGVGGTGGNGQGGSPIGGGGTGGTGGIPVQDDCADAGTTFIYVVTDDREIYAFDPSNESYTFTDRGALPCFGVGAQSMAVDRAGHAYVESNGHRIFRVGLANLAGCQATPFQDFGSSQFGMAFSSDQDDGGGETLFLAGQDNPSNELVSVDLSDFAVNEIGQFSKNIGNAELTGTGDGRLYAYGVGGPNGSHLAQIDKQTADVLSDMVLPFGGESAWAFAWWGGDFYFFTSTSGPSIVRRFQPTSGQFANVATAPGRVVGAGVSTCAPVD